MYKTFKLSCPRCKAESEDAKLTVISGTFVAHKMLLYRDGFSMTDVRQLSTSDEIVSCVFCGATFPLDECFDVESIPSFKGTDWTELADHFDVKILDEDNPQPLIDYICSHLGGKIYKTCRSFLDAIIAVDPSYNKPLWKGLAKVKKDETFISFFIKLLSSMWT